MLSLVISLGFSLPLSSLRDVVEGAMPRAKFVEKARTRNMIRALLYPVLFHGLFNFFLMWMSNLEGNNPLLIVLLFVAFFAVVVLLWRAGLRAIRIHSFRDFVDGIKY